MMAEYMIDACLNCTRPTCNGDCLRRKGQKKAEGPRSRWGRKYLARGEWRTMREWGEVSGVRVAMLEKRVNQMGWSMERAISTPARPVKGAVREAFGERHTLREWAEIKGVPLVTLKNRVNQLHWPLERALTQPVRVVKCHRVGEGK